jgi:nucleotide-binding universal stress UspA family protein
MALFKKIVVPIDFGETSMHALDMAVELAKQNSASLVLVHVWEIPSYGYGASLPASVLTHLEVEARRQLDAVVAGAKKRVPDVTSFLECGSPWREIFRVVEETKPDLVVMGTHGRRGLGHALIGSVAEKLLRISPAPVLTVRPRTKETGA